MDPAHAPVARVRGAKVVTYCSVACADEALTQPTAVPAAEIRSAEPASSAPRAKVVEAEPSRPREALAAGRNATESRAATREPELEIPVREGRGRFSARGRKRVLLAFSVIMLGGMAIVIIQAVSPSTPSPVAASSEHAAPSVGKTEPAASRETEPTAASDALSPSVLRTLAIAELRELMQSPSHRLQRLAAMALARFRDPEALARLVELFGAEDSDLSRIEIAYAQARGGVEDGREHLVSQLSASRRDVRIDAARRLVDLGDDAGRKTLVQMLSVQSHRLGAAALLARLDDESGKKVLHETLADAETSAENKMRAAVALGHAGDPQAAEPLKKILEEGKYVVDAAGALARLGDEAAIPALLRQLELTAMRVSAAEALVQLQPEASLQALATALAHGNDEARVSAAEAILILTAGEQDK